MSKTHPSLAPPADPVRVRWRIAVAAWVLAAVLLLASTAVAQTRPPHQVIASDGPLREVVVGVDLSCQIVRDSGGQIYPRGSRPANCGTFLTVVGQRTYGPQFLVGNFGSVGYDRIRQSAVEGAGTWRDPFRVTTRVAAGPHIEIDQEDLYVAGNEYFTSAITVTNNGGDTLSLRLARGWDCYLGGSDEGYGFANLIVPGSTGCSVTPNNEGEGLVEGLIPFRGEETSYFQGRYNIVWSLLGNGTPLPNTCECTARIDNGAALQWAFELAPGASITRSVKQVFSPEGTLPDSADLSPAAEDFGEVAPGAEGAPSTLTFANNGGNPIAVSGITVAGADAGSFRVTGGTCAVGGTVAVGATCSVLVAFDPPRAGDARAEVELTYVTSSGRTEAVIAELRGIGQPPGTHRLDVERFGSGGGRVTSKPAGIDCGPTCEDDLTAGTRITLTADPAEGSVFAGWGGICEGRETTCTVTMSRRQVVRAEFNVTSDPEIHTLTRIRPAKRVLARPGARVVRATVTSTGAGAGTVELRRCRTASCKTTTRIARLNVEFAGGPNAVALRTRPLPFGRYRIVATMDESAVTATMLVRAASGGGGGGGGSAEPVTG